ncbi:403_t:CDS:2 [Funneliformis geosporum]|nr:403_t:CDS:2 [Funneliformis geosporum]
MSLLKINIVGAGVIGLTTANSLLGRGCRVKIIARDFPNDINPRYTSTLAGADWRSFASREDIYQQKLDKETFFHFWKLAEEDSKRTGIMRIDDFCEYYEEEFEPPWFKKEIFETTWAKERNLSYQNIEKNNLPPGASFGVKHQTVSINPTKYLNYLFDEFVSSGGNWEKKTISGFEEVIGEETNVAINCTGLGAESLVKENEKKKIYPISGQVIIAKMKLSDPIGFKFKRKSGQKTYFITRSKLSNEEEKYEVVLGGTYDERSSQIEPDSQTTQEIIQGCKEVRPDLFAKELEIVSVNRGLRPYREGGVRIESESFGGKGLICHNYGHGGQGFQSSYGSANEVIKILREKKILS